MTPVLLNGLHADGDLLGRAPQAAQMVAVPEQEPIELVAVNETWRGRGRRGRPRGWEGRGRCEMWQKQGHRVALRGFGS